MGPDGRERSVEVHLAEAGSHSPTRTDRRTGGKHDDGDGHPPRPLALIDPERDRACHDGESGKQRRRPHNPTRHPLGDRPPAAHAEAPSPRMRKEDGTEVGDHQGDDEGHQQPEAEQGERRRELGARQTLPKSDPTRRWDEPPGRLSAELSRGSGVTAG